MKTSSKLFKLRSRFTAGIADRSMSLVLAILALGAVQPLVHGAALVDWLTFSAGGERTRFSLLRNSGSAFAEGQVVLTTGLFAPLSPAAGTLQSSFWLTPPPFQDSPLGDATVATTKVQVAPQGGLVQFHLTISGADLGGMVFAVGQLLSGGIGSMVISTSGTGGGAASVVFLGTNGWDNGLKFYTDPLDWDASQNTLRTSPGAIGESAFAFFQIAPGAGTVTSLSFDVPVSAASGSGDAVEFAFGVPVPEPGTTWLAGSAVLFACGAGRANRKKQPQ